MGVNREKTKPIIKVNQNMSDVFLFLNDLKTNIDHKGITKIAETK